MKSKLKILKILNNRFFWWFLIIVVMAILFIPALNIKFWWIDDGMSISVAQNIITSLTHHNFQGLNTILLEQGGRFRMIYWLYQTLVYVIGGSNPAIHFAIHFLVVLAASIFIYEIVSTLSKSNFAGFFAAALYILTPLNTENLYRLGPIEPILALCGIASIYYLIKEKITPAVLFLFLTAFVKETGFVIWLPILVIYLLKRIIYKKRDLNFEKYCLWGLIFFSIMFLNIIFRRAGYSTNYVLSPLRIINNFSSYVSLVNNGFAPFLVLFILSFIFRLVSAIRHKSIRKQGASFMEESIFLIWPFLFLVIQSPWEFVLSRYTMPVTVGLVVFMGIELGQIMTYLAKHKSLLKQLASIIFIGYFAVFSVGGIIKIYKQGERFVFTTNFIQELFSYLSINVPKNGVVLYNFLKGDSTEELVVETGMHLRLLYNRPDITVSYLDFDNLPKERYLVVGTPAVREQYPRELVEKSLRKYKKEEDIVHEKKFLVITTPYNLVKQIIKKMAQLVISKKPLSSDGIYTYYILRDYWYKYDVNK